MGAGESWSADYFALGTQSTSRKGAHMKAVFALALAVASSTALADNYHRGYTRSDGTYVQPHHQTQSDRNPYNNYSTQGNTNPYTGQAGTRDPYQVQQQYGAQQRGSYQNGQQRQRQRAGW
jgi:hypothetical protein